MTDKAESTESIVKINGRIIKSIIQRSAKGIVGVDENGAIQCEYSELELDFDPTSVVNKFHQLDSKLSRNLPSSLWRTLNRELGAAYYCALTSKTSEEGLNQFEEIETRINSVKEPEEAKLFLILSSFLISISLIGLLLILQNKSFLNQTESFLCMASGVCGAFFSLLNRNKEVKINLLGANRFIYIQAFIVAITGVLSGLVIYIFSNANIAFGFAEGNLFTLLAICLAAGFSERLVPDLFGKVKIED
jgi:hypothetical protein